MAGPAKAPPAMCTADVFVREEPRAGEKQHVHHRGPAALTPPPSLFLRVA